MGRDLKGRKMCIRDRTKGAGSLCGGHGSTLQRNRHWVFAAHYKGQGRRSVLAVSYTHLVIGKVGYAPVPAGPAGPDSPLHFSHWQLTLGPKSNNKEAAWLFLQWVTSSDLIKRCGLAMGTSTRQSLYLSLIHISREVG